MSWSTKKKRTAGTIGLLSTGAIAGAVVAAVVPANAATSTTTPSASSSTAPSGRFPPHGSAAHEALEKAVTGADATKAQAAAVKAVGSGTAGAVTTDMSGTGYEVTVTKADGSTVEVHLDSTFAVRDHAGPGGGPGDGAGGGPGGTAPSGSGTGA